MKLKTLLFSLSALIFFAACSDNTKVTSTADIPIEMPSTNIATATIEVLKNDITTPKITYIPYSKKQPWYQDMEAEVHSYVYLKNIETFDWNNKNAVQKEIPKSYIYDALTPIDYGYENTINFAQDINIKYDYTNLTSYGYPLLIDDELISFCRGNEFLLATSFLQKLKKEDKYYIHCAQIGVYTIFIISQVDSKNKLTKYHYIRSPYVYDENEDF